MSEHHQHSPDQAGAFPNSEIAESLTIELRRPPADDLAESYTRIEAARGRADMTGVHEAILFAIREAITFDAAAGESENSHVQQLRQVLVANGLADAYGEVYSRLRANVHEPAVTRSVVELATGQAYSESFEPLGPSSANLANRARIEPADWVALAALETNQSTRLDYLRRSAHSMFREFIGRRRYPGSIRQLITTAEAFDSSLLPGLLANLRQYRDVNHHSQTAMASSINVAVLEYLQEGRADIAGELIGPSPREIEQLRQAAGLEGGAPEAVLSAAQDIHAAKLTNWREGMRQRLGDDVQAQHRIERILGSTSDPNSALDVDPEFWQEFDRLPAQAREAFLASKDPLPNTASALLQEWRLGLLHQEHNLTRPAALIQDPAARRSYLQSLADAWQAAPQSDDPVEWFDLLRFQDAGAALEAAQRLFPKRETGRNRPASQLYVAMGGNFNAHEVPYALDLAQLAFLRELSGLIPQAATGSINLARIGEQIARAANPFQARDEVLAAMRAMQDAPNWAEGAELVLDSDNPVGLANAWREHGQEISELDNFSEQLLLFVLDQATDPARLAANTIAASRALEPHGYGLSGESATVIIGYAQFHGDSGSEVDPNAQEFASWLRLRNELSAAAKRRVVETVEYNKRHPRDETLDDAFEAPVLESPEVADHYKDPLENVPLLRTALLEVGATEKMAAKMYSSWMMLGGAEYVAELHGVMPQDFSDEHIELASDIHARMTLERLAAVKLFVARHGPAELASIHGIFRTVDFTRYADGQLHRQLERWNDPQEPVLNLSASSMVDPTDALSTAGIKAVERFGEYGEFAFEVGSKAELRQMAVRVWEREVAAGRDPLVNPALKNLVLTMHGSPLGLELGVVLNEDNHVGYDAQGYLLFNELSVEDYARAAAGRRALTNDSQSRPIVRPNDYSQYLGSSYRIILEACEPAGPIEAPKAGESAVEPEALNNIARNIYEAHGVAVEAHSEVVTGFVIEPDGKVFFEIEGTGRDARHHPSTTFGTWPHEK
jgi:hypothetical protein